MSCHSTSGGIVSTSLARGVTGLNEKEVQHIFHALKREAHGMPAPSELEVREWRSRQYDLLARMRRMSDNRRDKLRDRLFRSREESVPDGPTFHAWRTVEARARQEATLREIGTAVDLDPPGSQAHLYDLGEDGRPKRVWYASYGSNLHRDRFMNYIEGGSPEGSTRVYDGCVDPTPPVADIPIRFAGARPHFALTSRVWRGGIAFIDAAKGETSHGLGRAYDIAIDQFDDVVAQENGLPAKYSSKVPLTEALTEGRSVTGTGSYETILHIGDYQGAPVLTFTAPFSANEALTKSGHILRTPVGTKTPVRMPVMTNKPSAAYLRMIGSGLNETFGMDELQQADYLRGCPGGDRWERQQMVRILRGQEPDENIVEVEQSKKKDAKATEKSGTAVGGWPTTGPATGKAATSVTAAFSHAKNTAADEAGAVIANLRDHGLFPASSLPVPNSEKRAAREAAANAAAITANAPTGAAGTSGTAGTGKGSSRPNGKNRGGKNRDNDTANPARNPSGRKAGSSPRTSVSDRRRLYNTKRPPMPAVKAYNSREQQNDGVRRWATQVNRAEGAMNQEHARVRAIITQRELLQQRGAPAEQMLRTERNLAAAETEHAAWSEYASEARRRLDAAQAQQPERYYSRSTKRSTDEWKQEDERLLDQQRVTESAYETSRTELVTLKFDNTATPAQVATAQAKQASLAKQLDSLNNRLQETLDIITDLMRPKPSPPKTK